MFKILNDLELYVTLSALGQSRTLREAARKLGVSQATVSLRLKKLQEQTGYPLYEYQGKRLVFTDRGRALSTMVSELFERFPSELQRLHLEKDLPNSQPLRLGARIEVYDKILHGLRLKTPLDLRLMNSLEVHQGLIDLKLDVGISHLRPDNTQFVSVPLYEDEFVLCCHKSLLKSVGGELPSADRGSVIAFVSQVPALSYGHESRILSDWLSGHSVSARLLKISVVCENWNSLRTFLLNAAGFGVFPASFVKELPKQVLSRPVPHKILAPLRFYMTYRRNYRNDRGIIELKNALQRKYPLPGSTSG